MEVDCGLNLRPMTNGFFCPSKKDKHARCQQLERTSRTNGFIRTKNYPFTRRRNIGVRRGETGRRNGTPLLIQRPDGRGAKVSVHAYTVCPITGRLSYRDHRPIARRRQVFVPVRLAISTAPE